MNYETFYRRSVEDRDGFWRDEARRIHWNRQPEKILDYSKPPFARWFCGGETNLCYNAVDRHLAARGDQPALIYISTEVNEEKTFTYRDLHREVSAMAAAMRSLGVERGDRVVIYMPMIPAAIFTMLACARIGAIHSVVFGGFAAPNLAARIDDARPKLLVTSDGGMRAGKFIPYKHLVDEAVKLSAHPPSNVLLCRRGLDPDMKIHPGRDVDYAPLREKFFGAEIPCAWLESSEPSYILYTSGTTGKPKGVQRDTGGYAVALAASMEYVYGAKPGETMLTTSDIGWVVGHSYIVYGPLLHGMTSIVYEGLPIRPDPGVWWKIVQDRKVTTMFSSPTAIRVLKKEDASYLKKYDLKSLRYLFLAGEPLDEPTARWISDGLGVPVMDHYWQTETGWSILTYLPGVDLKSVKPGSPGFPAYGFKVRQVHEKTGEEVVPQEKGVLVLEPPLPPGCLTTVWGNDERFVRGYFSNYRELVYSTFDWAVRDGEGYFFILGRSDDVINVAGHRLGTREIEEAASSHPAVAEVAVVGVHDEVKGQMPHAFVVLKSQLTHPDTGALEKQISDKVVELLGAIARPGKVHIVQALPKTRSGKLLRRSIQAIAEGRDPGDLTTLDDPSALEAVKKG